MEYENCGPASPKNMMLYGVMLLFVLLIIYYIWFREGASSGRYSPRMVPIKDPRAVYGVVPRT